MTTTPPRTNKKGFALSFKIDGAVELEKALEQLPLAFQKAVLRRAAVKALQPVRDAAEAKAPVGPPQRKRGAKSAGKFKKSFVVNTQLSRSQQKQAKSEGFKESSKAVNVYVGSTDRKAAVLEFGTTERVQKTTGRRTGKARPTPVLRPAWDENKEKVFESFVNQMAVELTRAAARLAKKAIKGTLSAKERKALQS